MYLYALIYNRFSQDSIDAASVKVFQSKFTQPNLQRCELTWMKARNGDSLCRHVPMCALSFMPDLLSRIRMYCRWKFWCGISRLESNVGMSVTSVFLLVWRRSNLMQIELRLCNGHFTSVIPLLLSQIGAIFSCICCRAFVVLCFCRWWLLPPGHLHVAMACILRWWRRFAGQGLRTFILIVLYSYLYSLLWVAARPVRSERIVCAGRNREPKNGVCVFGGLNVACWLVRLNVDEIVFVVLIVLLWFAYCAQ